MALPPVPPLPDTARITEYAIVAQTGPFNVNFQVYGSETDYAQWIEVWLNGVLLTPTAQWTLASPSGSLSAVPRPITDAQVTLVAAGTGTLRILGAQRPRRLASYDEARAITARDENLDHNATRAIEREAWDGKSRILRVPPGETLAYLPPVATRANLPAGFDALGNLVPLAAIPGVVTVSPAVAAILNSATLTVFRNSLNVRRVLDVTQFGAVGDGATDSLAAWNAAVAAALPGEQIWVPSAVGNYVLSAPSTQLKQVQWILEPGAKLDATNAARAFTGLNTPINFPTNGDYGHSFLLSRNPTQHGIYVSVNFLDDGVAAINYESIGLFVIAQQNDPLGGLTHDVVGVSPRAYANKEDSRVYGEHVIALNQAGIVNASLVGGETDLLTAAASVEVNGYGTYQKIGHAYYVTGPKRGSRAIEIGLGSATWFQGVHINNGAIDAGLGYGFLWDNRFAVTGAGTTLIAKEVSNRQVAGVELQAVGSVWITNAGGASLIATRPGAPGPGTVLDISVQQQNTAAVVKNFIDILGEVATATAGAESGRVTISGLAAGAGATIAVIEGTRIGPGTDNFTNAGSAGQRYKEIFCVNNVINTSDEREKYGITPITDVVLDAWEEVSPQFYQWQASVAEKGSDVARIHAGYIAQRVIEAFEKHGLDPWRYALLCKDTLFKKEKRTRNERRRKMDMREVDKTVREMVNGQMVQRIVKEVVEVPAVRLIPVVDEAGRPVMEERREQNAEAFGADGTPLPPVDGKAPMLVAKKLVPVMHEEPVYEDMEVEYDADVETGDYRLGLRSDQCAVLEGAMLRRRLSRLEATIAALTKPAAPAVA